MAAKGAVDIFIPCILDQIYPEVAWDLVHLLEHLGYQVHYNPNQTCCGAPAYYTGLHETTREIAEKFLGDFQGNQNILCSSTHCMAMVLIHYNQFFKNTSYHNVYRKLQGNLVSFTHFIADALDNVKPKHVPGGKYFFWGACSGQNECGHGNTANKLLSSIQGFQLLNKTVPPLCCGNAGVMGNQHEEIAVNQLEKSLKQVLDYKPSVLVFDDPACMLHVDGYCKKNQISVKTQMLVSLLKEMHV